MMEILLTLLTVLIIVCILAIFLEVYPEIVEIHVFKTITIKIRNKEKRLKDSGKSLRRNNKWNK